MKTKDELDALKKETEALNKKLSELTEDELLQVTGGITLPEPSFRPKRDPLPYEEYGSDWTGEWDDNKDELGVKEPGTYKIEWIISKDE